MATSASREELEALDRHWKEYFNKRNLEYAERLAYERRFRDMLLMEDEARDSHDD